MRERDWRSRAHRLRNRARDRREPPEPENLALARQPDPALDQPAPFQRTQRHIVELVDIDHPLRHPAMPKRAVGQQHDHGLHISREPHDARPEACDQARTTRDISSNPARKPALACIPWAVAVTALSTASKSTPKIREIPPIGQSRLE